MRKIVIAAALAVSAASWGAEEKTPQPPDEKTCQCCLECLGARKALPGVNGTGTNPCRDCCDACGIDMKTGPPPEAVHEPEKRDKK